MEQEGEIGQMKLLLTITEIGMLAYWVFAALVATALLSVSTDLLYADASNPLIIAWNWSFLPIDIMFALCGLLGRFAPLTKQRGMVLSVVSLALMFCAGAMAISFWALQGWFDAAWWGMNLWLIVLSSFGLTMAFFTKNGNLE